MALGVLLFAPGSGGGTDVAHEAAPTMTRSRYLMGTSLSIEASGAGAASAIEAAFVEVERLEAILSGWRGDSEICRLNARAAIEPVPCSKDLFAAVRSALHWAEQTGGAFDPTVEPLVRWFGLRGPEGRLPGQSSEPHGPGMARGGAIGFRRVHLDAATRAVAFAARGMGLDLGGIGKGIALDAAARVLRERAVGAALLDFGGQLLGFGRGPDDGGWRVAVADPRDRDRGGEAFLLHEGSLSTSGQSERGRAGAGGPAGHILDPKLRSLATYDGTVTVLSADATAADALSTALFVMGPARGVRWAKSHNVDVLFLSRDAHGRRVRSGAGSLFNNSAADEAAAFVGGDRNDRTQ